MNRLFGRFLVTIGVLVVLWTLSWLVAYFIERGADADDLAKALTYEFTYWAPVLLMGVPGVILIHHGRRLLAQGEIGVIAIGEIGILFAIMGIFGAFVFPVDNFSYIAASVVANGVKDAGPVQAAVAEHYAAHGVFPSAGEKSAQTLPVEEMDRHTRSIVLGQGGRIVITFDTQDMNWHWSWWHRLWFIEPNDLTDKTLVLVPALVEGKVAWDECEEGTVPKRSRHVKCSGHK